MSGMAMTEHRDGDDNGSYLELVDAINERGAFPDRDRQELFRRIAFSILITNTDDHLRNTGFLWTGRKGWILSPAYDVNPVPNGPRILSTRIDFDDGTASIDLLRSVAEFSHAAGPGRPSDCRLRQRHPEMEGVRLPQGGAVGRDQADANSIRARRSDTRALADDMINAARRWPAFETALRDPFENDARHGSHLPDLGTSDVPARPAGSNEADGDSLKHCTGSAFMRRLGSDSLRPGTVCRIWPACFPASGFGMKRFFPRAHLDLSPAAPG